MESDTADQVVVFSVLAAALVLFAWGRWRYDVVALGALIAVTLAGVVDASDAFRGFGHPAVITVASVLMLSRGLLAAGVAGVLATTVTRLGEKQFVHLVALSVGVAVLSMFMNNVGALALGLPVAVRLAKRNNYHVGRVLMPMAFASLLGGMSTLIGTPPNLIISGFREENGGDAFLMFDYAPVGLAVAAAGLGFTWLIGWRFVPERKVPASKEDLFEIEAYVAEVRVKEGGKAVGMSVAEVEQAAGTSVAIAGLIRGTLPFGKVTGFERLQEGDALVVRADPDALEEITGKLGFELAGRGVEKLEKAEGEAEGGGKLELVEAVVLPGSNLANRSPATTRLRTRYGLTVLGVARRGTELESRVRDTWFQTADVLLIQGQSDTLADSMRELGLVPLADRELRIGEPRRVLLATMIFGVALAAAALGVVATPVAFLAAAGVYIVTGILQLEEAYEAIDWPIIVLLGAMLPVGAALESSGGAGRLADGLLVVGDDVPVAVALALLLVATMVLSDVINNAATTVVMAPIALGVAAGLDAGSDAFLMAVAIGASSAFLTPIGHQSNTMVMGVGGYRFGDYWRLGLPLEIVIVAVAVPMIMLVWQP